MARRGKLAGRQPPQLPLPARVIRVDPAGLGTAHAANICKCDDGCEYIVKDGTALCPIPHAEWLCTKLAEKLGIPSIPCRVVDMPTTPGAATYRKMFGSRYMQEFPRGGIIAPWYALVASGDIILTEISAVLSRIYAFDHVIHNIDRHLNNFFVSPSRTSVSIYSIDYSKAWTYRGFPLAPLPFDLADGEHRTVTAQRDLTRMWGPWINPQEVFLFLGLVKQIDRSVIKDIIESHPNEWLSGSQKKDILKWWGSKEFLERINGIWKGIGDGSYF